ncbi:hypothetical protein MBLNU230_g5647t1 [Neophaeotheca triangularis]
MSTNDIPFDPDYYARQLPMPMQQEYVLAPPLNVPEPSWQAEFESLLQEEPFQVPCSGWLNTAKRRYETEFMRIQGMEEGAEKEEARAALSEANLEQLRKNEQYIIRAKGMAGEDVDMAEAKALLEADGHLIGNANPSKAQILRKLKKKKYLPSENIEQFNQEGTGDDYEEVWESYSKGLARMYADKTRFTDHGRSIPASVPGFERVTLFDHQREGVGQLEHLLQEHSGALLADEMGTGKTYTTVALVQRMLNKRGPTDAKGNRHMPVLVVMPLSLLDNWVQAFEKADVKVLNQRTASRRTLQWGVKQWADFDVVLTTYDLVCQQWTEAKEVQYYWQMEADGATSTFVYVQRKIAEQKGARARKPEMPKMDPVDAPLLNIKWSLLILDEAHHIRNPNSKRALALVDFKADQRLALTGTPHQNRLTDIFSLLRFLRLKPWRNINTFNGLFKTKLKPSASGDGPVFRLFCLGAVLSLVTVCRKRFDIFQGRRITNVPHYATEIWLFDLGSKTQKTQVKSIDMWDKLQKIKRAKEAKEAKEKDPQASGGEGEVEGQGGKGAAFKIMHEARMNCIHLRLIEAKYSDDTSNDLLPFDEEAYQRGLGEDVGLPATQHDNSDDLEIEIAPHRTSTNAKNRQLFINSLQAKKYEWWSEKMDVLIHFLDVALQTIGSAAMALPTASERRRYLATHKIIIFSEYLAALDIVHQGIREVINLPVLRFSGLLSIDERKKVTDLFEEVGKDYTVDEPNPRIMLCTTKVAGEGLNLVHASEVFFVEPGWNPSVEDHCISRAARIGNPNIVTVHYANAQQSFEDRIRGVQQRKRGERDAIFGNDENAANRERYRESTDREVITSIMKAGNTATAK